jgi:glycosyltransferase involved in cell wall biosynthesis
MKVWHLTRTLYGGAGIYATRLSEALRDAGVESCVLSEDACPPYAGAGLPVASQLRPEGSAAAKFVTRVVRSMSHRLTSAPYHSLLGMLRYGGNHLPVRGDIIHLHGLTGWMGLRGLKGLVPACSPVFWTTHDLWPLSGGCILYSGCAGYQKDCGRCPILRPGVKGWARLELGMKERFVREKSIRPIANSHWMAEHIKESRIHQGAVDIPVVPPIAAPEFFAPEIGLVETTPAITPGKKVLALGARAVTDRYKGIPEFLAALAGRPDLASQFVVLLFGEGELAVPGGLDVRILGRLQKAEEIAKIYATSDVFVSASAMETFGMALAEAQACGTPVTAFDVGGVRDAVCEECVRFLVPKNDFAGLLHAVAEIASKTSPGGERWRLNRGWARERFAASVIADRQIRIYRSAVAGGSEQNG